MRNKRARTGHGSTCQKLIDFLESKGYSEITVYPATGAWRQKVFDVMSWEIHFIKPEHKGKGRNYQTCGGSWQTITEFLKLAKKNGFILNNDDEFWANEASTEAKGE